MYALSIAQSLEASPGSASCKLRIIIRSFVSLNGGQSPHLEGSLMPMMIVCVDQGDKLLELKSRFIFLYELSMCSIAWAFFG